MAKKSPIWQVTIHYTDGSTYVESDVRNFRSEGAERMISKNYADPNKVIDRVTSVQTGAKFSGEE